jgi:glycosyltransferase involved in cell wall biosynthesis
MMKVLMIDSLVGNDYSTCLCNGLHYQGLDVHLIVTKNREFSGDEKFCIRFMSPSKDKENNRLKKFIELIKYYIQLLKYIKITKPDIVHYQFFRRKSEILLFKLLKYKKIRLVYTAHNVLPHEKNKIDFYLRSLLYNTSDLIIVHSEYIKNKLMRLFPSTQNKIRIVPHGNFDIYLPKNGINQANSRYSFGLNERDNVILFFGFIRGYKGLDTLLEAFDKSADNDSDLKLLIAGVAYSKKFESYYHNVIDNLRNKERIIFHPYFIPKEDVARYFIASDVVVLPYKKIDHSGIIHLAYSFGKCVIATNVGDFKEVIQNNRSGIILEGCDSMELSEKINKVFLDKSELINMGQYAKHLSETKYSWNDIAKQTISAYREITS